MSLRIRLRGPEGKQHTCTFGTAGSLEDLIAEAASAFAIEAEEVEILVGFPKPTPCTADNVALLSEFLRTGDSVVVRLRGRGGANTSGPASEAPSVASAAAVVWAAPPVQVKPSQTALAAPPISAPVAAPYVAPAAAAPRIATLGAEPWECGICTLRNDSSAVECAACGTPKPGGAALASGVAPQSTFTRALAPGSDWQCSQCTLINMGSADMCVACDGPRPSGASAMASPAPVRDPAPATGAGVLVAAKRAFPGKDPKDLLATPSHASAKRSRGAEERSSGEGGNDSSEFRLDDQQVHAIIRALFGDPPTAADIERWLGASFNFSDQAGIEFGLWQRHGGPCGVFAPVQAFMLKHLLFGDANATNGVLAATEEQQQHQRLTAPLSFLSGTGAASDENTDSRAAVLAYALASVLFQATPTSSYVICQVNAPGSGDVGDAAAISAAVAAGGTLTVTARRASRISDAQRLLEEGALTWLAKPCGVLSFVVSVLVSRTLELVREDADDPDTPMIGRFGHCSQELVNLMLIGEATSNVFDGGKWLGDDPSTGMLLKGVDGDKVGEPMIGYLSELEAMRYLSVGTLYKHPSFPLWVLGSPTHYTLLFSTKRSDSQLSESASLQQRAKKIFAENSMDDGGIAYSEHLGKMLNALGIGADWVSRAETELIQENVVLWMDFVNFVKRAKGVVDTPGSSSRSLNLFLYDGQDPPGPSLRSIDVELTDVDPALAAASSDDPFAATLHTRWPNAVVTIKPFVSAAPKGSGLQ